jgi:membrane-bound serine protease (ClpP class)
MRALSARVLICIVGCMLVPVVSAAADPQRVLIATVADAIGPGTAEFLVDAMTQAEDSQAAVLIIQLDTPGGLAESMRQIVQAMYACNVPVVVYVWPQGARAASAGVMITMAADIAAMAPGTNIGAAHPVGAGGQEIGESMADKVVNDMVAFAKGIAQRRERNAEWVEKAIRESVSITAAEALDLKVIDLLAENLDDLIRELHGRTIPGKGRLDLSDVERIVVEETLRTKILRTISNPNVVYILFMIGLAGIYFELSNPGAIFPGVIGAIALILAFFAFQVLPVNTAGILLILLAGILFILEIKVTSFGLLSLAGIFSLVMGSLMLFKGAEPQFQLAWQVIAPTVLATAAFFVGVTALVVRAHARRPKTGAEGLIGEIGIVRQVDGFQGKVQVHGELWQARFEKPVSVGMQVQVLVVDNLRLTAAPLEGVEFGSSVKK